MIEARISFIFKFIKIYFAINNITAKSAIIKVVISPIAQ